MGRTIADQLRKLGIPESMVSTAMVNGKPLAAVDKPTGKRSDGWPGYRSKWESLYGMILDDQKAAGEIVAWAYEAVTLKLTDPVIVDGKKVRCTKYTADFAVWLPGGRLRLIEVKGYRRTKDINRYKQAKDKYREIEFMMVSRKDGAWSQIM